MHPKFESLERASEAFLEVTQHCVNPAGLRYIIGFIPPITMTCWLDPAVVKGREHAKRSESTALPGAAFSLAQAPTDSRLKPTINFKHESDGLR